MSVAFLFPGQGSQHVGMGEALYHSSPAARAVFDQADEQLGFSLSRLCFRGPKEALTDTINQQPALFTASVAGWQVMNEQGWSRPSFVAGHSLGEFAALVAAGSLTFAAGLDLVRRRGELMQLAGERAPGAMAALLALDAGQAADICATASAENGRIVQIANDNCPGQIVISGHEEAIGTAMTLAQEAGARKVVKLPISIAAHSPLMASVADEFATAVDAAPITDPQIPLIGNVTAAPLKTAVAIRDELKAQLTSPVAWTDSILFLANQGIDTMVEVGPGDVLLSLVKRIDRQIKRVKFTVNNGQN